MRPPTRIATHPRNPYEELARLADPEPDSEQRPTSPHDPPAPPSTGLGIPSDDDGDGEAWSPPNHRGRSRFAAVPVVVKLAVTVAAGAVLLTAGDRLAVAYAEERAEEKIQQSLRLAARPQVDIAGFPFLTQVLGKRIRTVD
ncbi:LmeA family phospholipid-binding protein, partial [Streptomyces lavendulocolor]